MNNSAQLQKITGIARVDRRTKDLTKRLRAGEIAVIDHADLDQVSAESLVECAPAAIVNAADSCTTKYPNSGPQILLDAGIPLLDGAGAEIMDQLPDGAVISLNTDGLYLQEETIGAGTWMDQTRIDELMAASRETLGDAIEAFAANTLEYMSIEKDILLEGVGIPEVRTSMEGRNVLVVVRGHHYKEDLKMLHPFIRDQRPILIGVDGGADALIESGYRPDLVIGDMDSVSDTTLRSGAEIVVHAYKDGNAPGLVRVEELGVHDAVVWPVTGTSEDIAMLLADGKGAATIVAVGTHDTMIEFLDKGRPGMASTFLTRLRVGTKLIDAKGVSRLYGARASLGHIWVLLLTAFIAFALLLVATPAGKAVLAVTLSYIEDFWAWIGEFSA